MLIGRRGAPDGLVGERPQGLATAPSGYFLCTVLKLSQDDARACGADGPKEVVVKRGWLPAAAAEAKQWTRPAGEVEVTGVLVPGEKEATFSPPNDPESGTMLWLQLPVLAESLGVSQEVLLEVVAQDENARDDSQAQSGKKAERRPASWPMARGAKCFESFNVMPETHAVYAATWWSLSAFGLGAAVKLLRKPAPPAAKVAAAVTAATAAAASASGPLK
mmetsp:Transcript_11315/g.26589  ORF Transcript_11315/g.26589 Transcript_11315/m.26589 type:complete len:220 (+) Transcript_11315:668-1327(+)